MTDDLTLGRLLGRREAFNIVAARCSAAEATVLRQVRDQKLYLNHAKDWDEFCTNHLHTNKQNANRLIRILEEFGPSYFEVSQLTRISPETFRAIAPSIQDQTLHHNGEAIALIPENAEKVAAAVAEIRKPKQPREPADPIPGLERSCTELVTKIEGVIALRQRREQVRATICALRSSLNRLEMTL